MANAERYEDFLGPLPQYAPDPRQERALRSVGAAGGVMKLLVDETTGRQEIVNLSRGWPASHPNLGFLQAAAKRLIALGKLDPRSKTQIHQLLAWAVQRISRVTVKLDPSVTLVRFWTKDDWGTYGFEFSVNFEPAGVPTEEDSRPDAAADPTTGSG